MIVINEVAFPGKVYSTIKLQSRNIIGYLYMNVKEMRNKPKSAKDSNSLFSSICYRMHVYSEAKYLTQT